MADSYRLEFSPQILTNEKNVPIYRINSNNTGNPTQFLTFSNGIATKYEFDRNQVSWQTKWNKSMETNDPANNRIIHFPTFQNIDNFLAEKTSRGINFYQFQNNNLNLILKSENYEENTFHDAFRWNEANNVIKMGHFYQNNTVIGMVTNHEDYGIQFYVINQESLSFGRYPIWSLALDSNPFANYSSLADIFLSDIKGKGQQNIIIRNKHGLNIFECDEDYEFESIMEIADAAKFEDTRQPLFFPNLTGQSFRDIVIFNKTGMFIYQYNNDQGNYVILHYNSLFSENKGWTEDRQKSILFEDIDFDGYQEMIFTGPRGVDFLSFDRDSNQWISYLDNNQLTISQRYGEIMSIIPANPPIINNSMIFTHYSNQLHWANIIPVDTSASPSSGNINTAEQQNVFEISKSTSSSSSQPIPQIVLTRNITEKPIRLLRDELDCSFIMNSLNKNTGRINFQLPLVDLSTISTDDIKLDLNYNGISQESDILGVGWSLPRNFITMDHQSSLFQESEKYFLVVDDMPIQLNMNSYNSTDTIYSFNVSNDAKSETQILYHKNEEKWEIKGSNTTQIYGRTSHISTQEPIIWEIVWKNWRGLGTSSADQSKIATSWYLAEVHNGHNVMKLTYDSIETPISGGNKFTREIYLKSITTIENEIIFKYAAKNTDEFKAPEVIDKNNFIRQQLVVSRYLNGYTLSTPEYRQNITFIYNTTNGKRLLTEIKQEDDPTTKPILQFGYKSISNLCFLDAATLPSGTRTEFQYESIGQVSSPDKQLGDTRLDVPSDHKVNFVNGDVIVSYIDNGNIILETFKKDTSNHSVPIISLTLGKGFAKNYEIIPGEHYFAVIIHYGSTKELNFLNKMWKKTSEFTFDEDAVTKFGKDFIVTYENSSVYMIQWSKDLKRWQKEIFKTSFPTVSAHTPLVAAFDNTFVVYNNNIFWLGFKDQQQKWQSKKLKEMKGAMDCVKTTLDKFQLNNEKTKRLLNFFQLYALQMYKNIFLLSRWNSEGGQLYTIVDLFVLDSKYEIAKSQQFKVAQENLLELKLENGDLTFAYKISNDKFKLVITDIKGPTLEDIRRQVKKPVTLESVFGGGPSLSELQNEAVENVKAQWTAEYEKSSEKDLLFNPWKHVTILNSQTIMCGNKTFVFNGAEWEDQLPQRKNKTEQNFLVLGDKLQLVQKSKNSKIELYELNNEKISGTSLVNLGITSFYEIFNAYPVYLAYYDKSIASSRVIEFSNDGNFEKVISLPPSEQLTQFSDHQMLVLSIPTTSTSRKNVTLVFHQMFGLNKFLPNPVVSEISFLLDTNEKRSTSFEYNSPKFQNNIVYYQELSIIPRNDKNSYGWIKEETYFGKPPEVKRKYFDGQGDLIKIQLLDEHQNEVSNNTVDQQGNQNINSTIFDKTGQFKVAEFFTNDISNEEIGYYGFEEYEINQIGLKSLGQKWNFEESDVVKNGFSFTGKSYLRLSKNTFYGTFQPKNQDQDYIASCWVRPHNEIIDDTLIAPFITANILLEHNDEVFEYTRLGQIKYQFDDWYYVEVLINFSAVRDTPKYNENSTQSAITNQNLKISIFISTTENSTVDVDHIRFSPLQSSFKGTVYDQKTMQIKEEIGQDGLIKQYIYDKHNKEVASIDKTGHLKEVKSYTKASSIDRIQQLNNIVQIQPETGFYEKFAPFSFKNRWKIDTTEAWQLSPNHLSHLTTNENNLSLNLSEIDSNSYGMRFYLTLGSKNAFLKFGNGVIFTSLGAKGEFSFLGKRLQIPLNSEIIIINENIRLFIWVDGGLYFDGYANSSAINKLSASGNVILNDMIVFNKPSIQITYYNSLQEKLQEIKLENDTSVIVKEYLYDELGRQTITTQAVCVTRTISQPLLSYYPNFVINKNPSSTDSVWKTGKLEGELKDAVGEYGYSQIKYSNNPLNEKIAEGLPGKEFSIFGPYSKQFSASCSNTYINNVYPISRNFTHQVEYKAADVKHIVIFDYKKNKVAKYIDAQNSPDILSTYEYDSKGNIITILPPLYHEKAQTLMTSFTHNTSTDYNTLKKLLGISVAYDDNSNVISRETPDSQKVEHVYDNGLLKFTIHYNPDDNLGNVTYFDYDNFDRLYETGELIGQFTKQQLTNLTLTTENASVYQQFDYNDLESEPILRKKTKRIITFNEGNPTIEKFTFNNDQETTIKQVLIQTESNEVPQVAEIRKIYKAGKVLMIEYPTDFQDEQFKLMYKYNKLGQMISIGVPHNENLFVNFLYNADSQVSSEHHSPNSNRTFIRQYNYNTAGFLILIEDKFLTEEISYTEKSYGGYGYGDGTITATKFSAKWHKHCNNRNLNLNKYSFIGSGITSHESELCFNKLKEAGYIDGDNHQQKIFYPKLNQDLPMVCTYGVGSRHIQKILGMKGFPSHYGHSYDYGNHQELTKGKYFVGNEMPLPLQPDTFSKEISKFNSTTSRDIWQTLHKSGYIIQNNEKSDFAFGHGKLGKSMIHSNMFDDLGNISVNYRMYENPLQRIIVSCLAKKQKPTQIKSALQNAISKWISYQDQTTIKQVSNDIVNMLEKMSYLINPFTEEFNSILQNYQSYIPEIVGVLQEHFGQQLGEAEFDVESYDIDANGNHKLFYTGFDRYQLEYKDNTNQINNVKYLSFSSQEGSKNFEMKHDNRGNVIQALHKGIKNIKYHPVSNRPIKIELIDGRGILFHYDMQGERILKRLVNEKEETIYEIHYLRDETGKPLAEKKLTFISSNLPPDVMITTYIYGPRGLVGFLRRNEFFSIFADHEGSIRLVIRGDEVVAAYDYLPYGDIMRKFENNPESYISYLYTGQELDEETGLYNFHARFYDPSIGRFYQIDPREQYFNPYKYAGNSPVSTIDPDGEFAFLIPIAFGLLGAYLGGASANNNWNPLKWELNKASTWLGVVGGGIGGALMPMGFAGSVGFFSTALSITSAQATALTVGLGLGASYINMVSVNGKFNPAEWSFTPATFNAAFQGFALGSGLGAGIQNARKIYSELSSKLAKGAYLSGTATTGAGIFTLHGSASDWDFKNPLMWAGLLDAFTMAPDLPILLRQGHKFFTSHGNIILKSLKYGPSYKQLDSLHEYSKKMETVFSILKNAPGDAKSVLNLLSSDVWKNTAIKYPAAFSAFAMTLGIGSIAGTGYAIYTEAKENGGDIHSIYLYHSMINGMISVGQLSLSYKNPKFKKSLNKEHIKPLHEDSNSLKIPISSQGKHLNWDEDVGWLDHNLYKSTQDFDNVPRKVEMGGEFDIRKSQAGESKTKKDPQKPDQEGDTVMKKCLGTRRTRSVRKIRSITNPQMKNKKTYSNHEKDAKNKHSRKNYSKYGVTNLQKPKPSSDTIFSGSGSASKTNSVTEIPPELVHRIETIVADTIKRYVTELKKFSGENFDKESKNYEYYKNYGKTVQKMLREGEIPNKVISVIISKNEAFVGFSNNKAPGMVSYYYNEGRDYVFLRNNAKVGKTKADNKPEGNQFLRETQSEVNALVTESKRIFTSKIKDMQKNIQEAVIRSKTETADKTINYSKEGKQFAQYIVKKFKEHVWNELQDITKLRKFDESQRLKKLHDFMSEYSATHTTMDIMKLESTIRESTLIKEISNMANAISSAPFESWSPQNCGEPHALTALKNKKKLFRKDLVRKPQISNKNIKSQTRSTEDISYMMAFEVPSEINFLKDLPNTMQLSSKERCIQCKYTSYGVNVLTDGKNQWSIPRAIKFPEEVESTKIDDPLHHQSEERRKKRSVFGEFNKYYENPISSNKGINPDGADRTLHFEKNNTIEYVTNNPSQESDTSSSWMNNWFSWLKNSTNNFLNITHKHEISHETETPFESTASQSGMQFDSNGTILLLDLLVRKATGEKFVRLKDSDEFSLLEIQGNAISIVTEFEDLLTEIAIQLDIPQENLIFDPIKVQEIIIDLLRNGQFSKISPALYSYAKKANPKFEQNALFLTNLKHRLEKSFDTKNSPKSISTRQKLFKNQIPVESQDSRQIPINFFNTMTLNTSNKTNIESIN